MGIFSFDLDQMALVLKCDLHIVNICLCVEKVSSCSSSKFID